MLCLHAFEGPELSLDAHTGCCVLYYLLDYRVTALHWHSLSLLYRVATNAAKVLEEKGTIRCLYGIISWLEVGK